MRMKTQPHPTARKRGFNLIEIAIVLAIIGVVVGGIYVAAGSVREKNRLQTMQNDVAQLVQNVRQAYTTKARFLGPTYAQIKTMNLMPADVQDNGSGFLNPYNGNISLYNTGNDQQIGLALSLIPKSACINLLSQNFGTSAAVKQVGLLDVGNGLTDLTVANTQDGITVAEATGLCGSSATTTVQYSFSLRGN